MASGGVIPDRLYFRIGDVADIVGVKPYVLRYWESEFPIVSPEKSATGQRVYRRHDVENLMLIKHLLYKERYSIEGARNRIRELKREGSLKNARQTTVETQTEAAKAADPAHRERRQRIRALARELKALSGASARDIFTAG
jgi:DNA-binding transcriptional MerR regulator